MQERRDADFGPNEQGLRDDVRRLGRLVGELLVEQHGEAFFARVESARNAAISRRENDEPAEALAQNLGNLDAATADAVSRAFSTYFQVVNLADTNTKIERPRKQKKMIRSTSSASIVRQYVELQRLRDRLSKEESWRAAR